MMSVVEKIKQEIIEVEKLIEEEKKHEEECIANLETICNPLMSQAYKRGFRDAKKGVLKDYEEQEAKNREALLQTCKKLNVTIEYLRREIANIKAVEKQKLRELHMRIHKKRQFESQHTQLDKELGYTVSKSQQEFLDFLIWLDTQFVEVFDVESVIDTKKETKQ